MYYKTAIKYRCYAKQAISKHIKCLQFVIQNVILNTTKEIKYFFNLKCLTKCKTKGEAKMKKSEQYKVLFTDNSKPMYFNTLTEYSNYMSTTAFSVNCTVYSPKDENGNRELLFIRSYQ